MENVPPSYESAVARNPWGIIAPYIPSAELCALNRVNRELHCVFAPYLWGNPASHFGTEHDRVYVALTRFKRILKRVRLSVRKLTHTLYLPPAQPELYDGPRPEWLLEVLEKLPNLQSLVVSRLPFFDHMALIALRNRSNSRRSTPDTVPSSPLRLLIAAHCQNPTPQGLVEAMSHFQSLAYLDLSNTLAARDTSVLSMLQSLTLLQVLKLRNIHLRDEDIEIIGQAIGVRVRSLDVRGNHLTDRSVRILLRACFQVAGQSDGLPSGTSHCSSNPTMEDWAAGLIRPDLVTLDEFKVNSYDERFVRRLTSGIVSRLPYEDLPNSGITHLYIADNDLTIGGLAALVSSKKLFVLDIGTVKFGRIYSGPQAEGSQSLAEPDARHNSFAGVNQIIPILTRCACEMTSLRLHHAVILDHDPPTNEELAIAKCENEDTTKQELEEPRAAELDARTHEMDATPPLYEMPLEGLPPRYELAGDPTHLRIPAPTREKPAPSKEEPYPKAGCRGDFPPEVEERREPGADIPTVLAASGLGFMAYDTNGFKVPPSSGNTDVLWKHLNTSRGTVEMQLALIERERRNIRSFRPGKPHGLIPGMLPKLRTITLTDVPCYAKTRHIVDALIQFIRDCASEATLTSLQAGLESSSLLKPGGRHSDHDRHDHVKNFALRQIILEMAPCEPTSLAKDTRVAKYVKRTKSSTEDPDSEAFWSAAENDFTFFRNDEECGRSLIDTNTFVPRSALSEKMIMPVSYVHRLPNLRGAVPLEPPIDVIQELSYFRKERKAAYENAISRGMQHVAGYWSGEVKVVRGQYTGQATDFYGNHFSAKGGVYR